ncbi:MAG: AzlC family ABC transporter permease [Oscillospiraceae bacterium]|nr:AzlC family ABC transporter permease [Oscillospiraceae bacterium]
MDKNNFKTQYKNGFKAGVPVILGFVPVGIAFAVMARQAGFSIAETCGSSIFVFAGAAQMMSTGMYAKGAGIVAIILATFVLNLRHLIMATVVMNRMKDGSTALRLLASFGITDESFAIFSTTDRANCNIGFFLGLITVTYSSWIAGTAIGAVANDFFPAILTASLAVSLYAMFIGLLVPNLHDNAKLAALVVMTGICNTVLSQFIASSWALIVSTLVCAFIGSFFVDMDENREGNADGCC